MTRIVPTITLLFVVHGLTGQSPFARSYEAQTDLMETTSVDMSTVEAANGDLLLCSDHALHDSLGNTYYVSLIHRLTADGVTQWRKKVGSVNDDLRIMGIRELPDGTIAVVGVMGSGSADAALLRFNPIGDLLLARRYTAVDAIGFNDIIALTDSTLLVAGYCSGSNGGPLTMIVSNDGTILDATVLAYPGLAGGSERITRCADGGYLLVGDGAGELSGDGHLPIDLMIAKLDSIGILTWATRLERSITWGSEFMQVAEGNEIPGQGFRIVADDNVFVPFGHGFVLAALTAQGQLTWSRKFTPSFSFPARVSMNVNDTTLAITGGYLQGNVISIIGSSGVHLGSYVTHPDGGTRAATRTSDGMIVTAGLATSAFSTEADAPILIKDEPVPTMCSVEGVAMAQDTFGLIPFQDHLPVPLAVADSDLIPDLSITDQVVVETPHCMSTMIVSEDPPSLSTWLAGNRLILTGGRMDGASVIDLSGRVVKAVVLDGQDRGEIDLSGTASGIYTVLVQQGPCVRASKVLKE